MSSHNTEPLPLDLQNDCLGFQCFKNSDIDIGKVTLMYGKNGTGKTSLSKFIENQFSDVYDVRIFNGFNGVINSNNELDLVTLGEENVKIDDEITKLKAKINNIDKKIETLQSELEHRDDTKEDALIIKYEEAETNVKFQAEKIEKILKNIASSVKKENDPQIADVNYNIRNIKNELSEIDKHVYLSDNEISNYIITIKTDEKIAPELNIDIVDFKSLTIKVESAIQEEIAHKKFIARLSGDNKDDLIEFARNGLKIHKKGDVCAFCGSVVKEKTIIELSEFFDTETIGDMQNRLSLLEQEIKNTISNIDAVNIIRDSFYPDYHLQVEELQRKLEAEKEAQITYLQYLLNAVVNKNKNITKIFKPTKKKMPDGFNFISNEYEKLRNLNNSSNLRQKKDNARKKLRLDFIFKSLKDYDYYSLKSELEKHEAVFDIFTKQKKNKEDELLQKREEICSINKEIEKLQNQTINVNKLADKINKNLEGFISFKLISVESETEGNYQIEGHDGKVRKVEFLSKGEKNILAFLYFYYKLNEVSNNSKQKLVVFDDPMSSNDEIMQYIIMEKLIDLTYKKSDNENELYKLWNINNLVVMTHNMHLFLNLTRSPGGLRCLRNYVYILNKSGPYTNIEQIDKEKISNSYDSLWYELIVLYKSEDTQSFVLVNPMRRIIETFLNFNCIDADLFYDKEPGIRKYLNVNSHEVDALSDLNALLSGISKEDLLILFKSLFKKNNYENHYTIHFNKFYNNNHVKDLN